MPFVSKLLNLTLFVLTLTWGGRNISAQDESADHKIASGDTVGVRVFQEPDLDSVAVISSEGKITLSLVGEVNIAGLTSSAAARVIESKFKQGYLANPKVTVSVGAHAKRRFTILGAVNKPGAYFFPDGNPVSILQAIGMAGGYTKAASPSKISVKRGDQGKVIKINGKKAAEDDSGKAFLLENGDVVTVDESLL